MEKLPKDASEAYYFTITESKKVLYRISNHLLSLSSLFCFIHDGESAPRGPFFRIPNEELVEMPNELREKKEKHKSH